MGKRNEKTTRPAAPRALGSEELGKVSGGSLHPVFPPGQFPSPEKPGWHPGHDPGKP
jgi:hypothetical protein